MYSKGFTVLAFLFILVGQVYMKCDKKIMNPTSRAEMISCARNHAPKLFVDIVLSCIENEEEINTYIDDACSGARSNPRAMEIERCLDQKENQHREAFLEIGRTYDEKPFKRCIEEIEEPESEENITDIEELFDR